MHRQNRLGISLFSRNGSGKLAGLGVSDSPEYWPLTIVPSAVKSRRSKPAWATIGALIVLAAALALAYQHGIAAR